MKVVRIRGGLGNQMFQCALLLALRYHFDEPIYADTTWYGTCLKHSYQLEYIFRIGLQYASDRDIKSVTHHTHHYILNRWLRGLVPHKATECRENKDFDYIDDIFSCSSDRYYDGYFEDVRYFSAIEDDIRAAFTFKRPLSERNEAVARRMREVPSVSLHVRRGDYMSKSNKRLFGGICDMDYYAKAINYMRSHVEGAHFFVFSNDIVWCKEHISPLLEGVGVEYIDWNRGWDNYVDMQLMSCCRHNIIANSTFSWWGAWLNDNKQKIVVSPRYLTNVRKKPFALDGWVSF